MAKYADVAKLLNMYQLWLDDLYPRAKFMDGLAIIEKLGHSKRMQTMRKEWINESKPRDSSESDQIDTPAQRKELEHSDGCRKLPEAATSVPQVQTPLPIPGSDDEESYSATCRATGAANNSQRRATTTITAETLFVSDDEEEDDLDALMAEDEAKKGSNSVPSRSIEDSRSRQEDQFDDEMEVMAGLNDMW